MKTNLFLMALLLFSFSFTSCNGNKNKNNVRKNDSIENFEQAIDTVSPEDTDEEITSEPVSQPQEPEISSWNDVAKILGKKYKVKGIWVGEEKYSSDLIIYSKSGKYYLSICEISENPLSDNEQMPLIKNNRNTFTYKGDGDMPERFIINGNQLDSYTYNPDVSEWVYMGSYQNVY